MDYINYVKQSPMSMSGMGGPVGALNFHSGSAEVTTFRGNRGITAMGIVGPTRYNNINYYNLASPCNASNFGTLTQARGYGGSAAGGGGSTASRGVFGAGSGPSGGTNIMDYITIGSTGNATDFGDLTQPASYVGSAYNSTRAWRMGGYTPSRTNTTDSITIDTTSNATTWGDLIQIWRYSSGCSNGPRFVNMGGDDGQGPSSGETGYYNNTIQYFSADSTGNASNFGNLWNARNGLAGMSGNAS